MIAIIKILEFLILGFVVLVPVVMLGTVAFSVGTMLFIFVILPMWDFFADIWKGAFHGHS